MLEFNNGSHTVFVDRDGLEAIAQEQIAKRLEESKEISPLLRSSLKGVADMLLSMSGIKVPKGADKLEFLTAYILKLGLDAVEKQPIPTNFTVLENAKAPEDGSSTD